eukprot:gnl/TRDRNA2_/TRDRNA2_44685_c0_seq2.p1 gnl/TRDRNA2_/TRDRNA2_44685_c0~~gnl/TRDRNA2_/TRDRNA2_44685_c0_seq2.p1  ORF type:complete len:216 (-),score=32.54 gnl/TRDRNA2_/TRDRNA2_44685_c0_seq2:120-767(-)
MDEDLVLLSDADEVPRAETLAELLSAPDALRGADASTIYVLAGDFYYYSTRCLKREVWVKGPRLLTAATLARVTPNVARFAWPELGNVPEGVNVRVVTPHASWHFSYFGGLRQILGKLTDNSHQEFNLPHFRERSWIGRQMRNCRDLFGRDASASLDSFVSPKEPWPGGSLPAAMLEDPQRWLRGGLSASAAVAEEHAEAYELASKPTSTMQQHG